MGAIPLADGFSDLGVGNFKREETLGSNRSLDLGVRRESRRTAKVATLRDASSRKNTDCLTALAFDGHLAGCPAALLLWNFAQGSGEVVFNDFAGERFLILGDGAAKGAAQFLRGRFPLSLGTARWTIVFGGGENLGHDGGCYP